MAADTACNAHKHRAHLMDILTVSASARAVGVGDISEGRFAVARVGGAVRGIRTTLELATRVHLLVL